MTPSIEGLSFSSRNPAVPTMNVAYLALDVHAASCTLGLMNGEGTYLRDWKFSTAESELIPHVVGVEAESKVLALEECSLAAWVARTLEGYVDEVYVCDPRKNALISQSALGERPGGCLQPVPPAAPR